jgi:hypothetical protein
MIHIHLPPNDNDEADVDYRISFADKRLAINWRALNPLRARLVRWLLYMTMVWIVLEYNTRSIA